MCQGPFRVPGLGTRSFFPVCLKRPGKGLVPDQCLAFELALLQTRGAMLPPLSQNSTRGIRREL